MPTIRELFPDELGEIMPSEYQEKHWAGYLDTSVGPNKDGAFSGHCPIHDTERKEVSALFYFKSGIMTCLKEPSCHQGRKYISLTNVALMMAGHAK